MKTNWKPLVLMIVTMLIIVYIFSTGAYAWFQVEYESGGVGVICSTLLQCFAMSLLIAYVRTVFAI